MALIDILTHWGAKKKAAQAAKTVKHGVSGLFTKLVRLEDKHRRFFVFTILQASV